MNQILIVEHSGEVNQVVKNITFSTNESDMVSKTFNRNESNSS